MLLLFLIYTVHSPRPSDSAGAANAVIFVTNILLFVWSLRYTCTFSDIQYKHTCAQTPPFLKALLRTRTLNIYITLIGINSKMLGDLLGCVSKPVTHYEYELYLGKS